MRITNVYTKLLPNRRKNWSLSRQQNSLVLMTYHRNRKYKERHHRHQWCSGCCHSGMIYVKNHINRLIFFFGSVLLLMTGFNILRYLMGKNPIKIGFTITADTAREPLN